MIKVGDIVKFCRGYTYWQMFAGKRTQFAVHGWKLGAIGQVYSMYTDKGDGRAFCEVRLIKGEKHLKGDQWDHLVTLYPTRTIPASHLKRVTMRKCARKKQWRFNTKLISVATKIMRDL